MCLCVQFIHLFLARFVQSTSIYKFFVLHNLSSVKCEMVFKCTILEMSCASITGIKQFCN